ncbi:hypothetical protein FIV38_03610 [Pseudomonas proteolytica]|nr:hypothetical protein F4W61_00155 [Pseudomonas proteolytica]QHG26090.1 hypothetical protein GDV60_25795 [Pseudomonas sp. DTU12.1]TWR85608.1 hypothetical protein FIV38_03610 [Pseudomonas proteolytica]
MRRIVCRRFGASICPGTERAGCKNDRGIAESVNPRQRVHGRVCRASVLWPTLEPEFDPSTDMRRRNETDFPGFGTPRHWRPRGRRHRQHPV